MKLNDFFSIAVINLKIPKFENFDPFSENIDHPLKAIFTYRKHPSIIAIVSEFTKECFSFNTITVEINILDNSKAIQAIRIPVKVIKGVSILL